MNQKIVSDLDKLNQNVNRCVLMGEELASVLYAAQHSAGSMATINLIQAGERTLAAMDALLDELEESSGYILGAVQESAAGVES